MSGRVQKQKKSQSARRRKGELLKAFSSSRSVPMPSCTNCTRRGQRTCIASPGDSSRCEECVRSNRSGCDVLGATDAQLQTIAAQHARLEREVADAAAEAAAAMARFQRVQAQKSLWFDRMMTAVSRGLADVEELEKVEAEEQAQAIAETAATNVEQAESISGVDWTLPSDFALDPGLLADLGIPGSVETPHDTQSGS